MACPRATKQAHATLLQTLTTNTTQQRWVMQTHRCSRISCRGVTVRSPLLDTLLHSLSHKNLTPVETNERNNPLTIRFPHSRPRRSRQTTKAFHEIGQSAPPSPPPKTNNPTNSKLTTTTRTDPAQSSAKNSCNSPKSPPTLSPRA